MRQNLEKNIEKVVAIALSLGMVALNTCSNGGYSYRVNSTSSDKNNGNIAYASELTSPEANNLVECDDLESREAPQEIKSVAPKIKMPSQPKVIVKKSINHDVDVTTPAIDDEPLDVEEDIWDKLIKDYEKYEIKDVDNVDIPDEDDPVNIDDDNIAEPIDDPADLETNPDVNEDVAPDVTDDVNNSEENTKDVLPESEIMPDPAPEIEPKVEEKPAKELTPVLVETPFGKHIEVAEKPVDTKTTEPTQVDNITKPESDPKDTETKSEPANDNVNIVIMNEQDEFLSKIPEEGVNGYSKDFIKALLYTGLGVAAVATIIGVSAWLIYK